jgi:hypothetical protein
MFCNRVPPIVSVSTRRTHGQASCVVHAQIVGLSKHGVSAEFPAYEHRVQAVSGIAAQQAVGDSGLQHIR